MELPIDDERVDTCELGPISIRVEPAAIGVLLWPTRISSR